MCVRIITVDIVDIVVLQFSSASLLLITNPNPFSHLRLELDTP